MSSTIDRRDFVKRIAGLGAAACGARSFVKGRVYAAPVAKVSRDIAVANGGQPFENTVAAVEALGGMAKFVKPGTRVLINPNVSGHLPPDAAVNTHPHVVGALIKMCRDVGAGEVIVGNFNNAKNYKIGKMDEVAEKGIVVSLFIDAEAEQIEASKESGADAVELHTGRYAEAAGAEADERLAELAEGCDLARRLGLVAHAGHGLTYRNVRPVALIEGFDEFNIGHSIVARSVFVGIEQAVREMKRLITV